MKRAVYASCDGIASDDLLLREVNRFSEVDVFSPIRAAGIFYGGGKGGGVKETKEELALAEVAEQKWKYYQDNYKPIENEYMNRVDQMDSDGSYGFVKGAAGSSTAAAFENPKQQVAQQLQTSGVNPNSGKYKTTMSGLADAQGASAADSMSRAQIDQQDQFIQGVSNVSAMGRGQATTAQAGLSDVASTAAGKAQSDATNAWNNRAALNSSLGTVAGAAAHGAIKSNSPTLDPIRPDSTRG